MGTATAWLSSWCPWKRSARDAPRGAARHTWRAACGAVAAPSAPSPHGEKPRSRLQHTGGSRLRPLQRPPLVEAGRVVKDPRPATSPRRRCRQTPPGGPAPDDGGRRGRAPLQRTRSPEDRHQARSCQGPRPCNVGRGTRSLVGSLTLGASLGVQGALRFEEDLQRHVGGAPALVTLNMAPGGGPSMPVPIAPSSLSHCEVRTSWRKMAGALLCCNLFRDGWYVCSSQHLDQVADPVIEAEISSTIFHDCYQCAANRCSTQACCSGARGGGGTG